MSTKLSKFENIDGINGVFCATKGSLRCTAIQLKDQSLCLFSPVSGLNDEAVESLAAIGKVSYLLAPNHWHNKGLIEYGSTFSNSIFTASKAAMPRLEKLTKLNFQDLKTLSDLLPSHISILYPDGLKTGEIWLRIEYSNSIAWLVVDAFCSKNKKIKISVVDEPELLGPFPKMGVGNKDEYYEWAMNQLQKDKPTMVIPCHGSLISSKILTSKLEVLMKSLV